MSGLDVTTTIQGEMYACLYAREFPAQAVMRLRPELRGGAGGGDGG